MSDLTQRLTQEVHKAMEENKELIAKVILAASLGIATYRVGCDLLAEHKVESPKNDLIRF